MEIVCYICQGVIEVTYKLIVRVDKEEYVTYCPGCGAKNEVWDVEEWFEPEEVNWVHKYQSEFKKFTLKDLSDNELLLLLEDEQT